MYNNADFQIENGVLNKYIGTDEDIIIPDEVVEIGGAAFSCCESLKTVKMSDNVVKIGNMAFYNCTNLARIAIPDTVTSIGFNAFFNCTKLLTISLGNGLKIIEDSVFACCESLTNISIPDGVSMIGCGAFESCSSLISISIPDSVVNIGEGAFTRCIALKTITLPNNLTSISKNVFFECQNINNIVIPERVTSIGDNAFGKCCSLTNITIPENVKSIGSMAFYFCFRLKTITILNNTIKISDNAFLDCNCSVVYINNQSNKSDDTSISANKMIKIYDELIKEVIRKIRTDRCYNYPETDWAIAEFLEADFDNSDYDQQLSELCEYTVNHKTEFDNDNFSSEDLYQWIKNWIHHDWKKTKTDKGNVIAGVIDAGGLILVLSLLSFLSASTTIVKLDCELYHDHDEVEGDYCHAKRVALEYDVESNSIKVVLHTYESWSKY